MQPILIDHPHAEASALLGIRNTAFLKSRGWDLGFWIVSDEMETSEAIAALGRNAKGEWDVVRLRTKPGDRTTSKTCEDCETLARAGSRVYVFGSQYGTKEGPLQPKRHFVARFNEALIDVSDAAHPTAALDLTRRPFVLHRAINDAIRAAKIALRPMSTAMRRALIGATIVEGKEKTWGALVRRDDAPINIEGATFLEGGVLLLGLRYPVTENGNPIIAEIEGIDRLFEDDAPPPVVTSLRVLTDIGSRNKPAGIRELDARGGMVHAITGDLDDELLVEPKASKARSEHWANRWPEGGMTRVREFDARAQVEGIALIGDDTWYVHDDAKIRLERA